MRMRQFFGSIICAVALTGCWNREAAEQRRETRQAERQAPQDDTAPRFTRTTFDAAALAELQAIESRVGGRLGVMLVAPDDRVILANRETERFPICSTFKLPLAVMILSDVDAGTLEMSRELSFADRRVVENSPVVEQLVRDADSSLSVEQALAAALVNSDNTAANLLLTLVGDNSGYSQRIITAFGNDSIRMDRSEGVLNEDASRVEDTATPDAMVAVLARVFHGSTLSAASRDRLAGWMNASRTGTARVRAGLPDTVRAGDKTGTCSQTYNSVGWVEMGAGQRPWLYAAYLDETDASEASADRALAEVGALFARLMRPAPERSDAATPALAR